MFSEGLKVFFSNVTTAGVLENGIHGSAGSKTEGAFLEIYLQLDEKYKIKDARFKAQGCEYLIGLASYVTQDIKGKNALESEQYKAAFLAERFELPQQKLYTAFLVEDALQDALKHIKK